MSSESRRNPFPQIDSADDGNGGKPQWFTKATDTAPPEAPSWSHNPTKADSPPAGDTEAAHVALEPAPDAPNNTSATAEAEEQGHSPAHEEEDTSQLEAQHQAQQEEELRARIHEEIYQQSHEQGYQDGLQAGEQAGYEEGLNKTAQAVEEQTALLEAVITAANVWQAAEQQKQLQDLSELICVLTEQVVLAELKLSPEVVTKAVSAAFQSLPRSMGDGSAEIPPMVTINPEDLERVTSLQQQDKKHWQIVTDDTVEQGGCLVKTAQSDVNATIEHRLQQAKEAIRMVFHDAPP